MGKKSDAYTKLWKLLTYEGSVKQISIEHILDMLADHMSGDELEEFYYHVKKEYEAGKTT